MKTVTGFAILTMALGFLIQVVAPKPADAVPAFARKYETTCSTCHAAWPLLNATGRNFKENGYRFSVDEEPKGVLSELMEWGKILPISARIVSRPYDKKEGSDRKLRAVHEIELFVAGYVGKNLSVFFELEAEDENDFEPEVAGFLNYHVSPYLNFQFFYEEMFKASPYDTLSGSRRLTRGRNAVIDQRFGGADNNGKIRDARQGIAIYGRAAKTVFYTIGYTGAAKDAEGVNANNFHGKLSVDILPELTIGAFGVIGQCKSSASNCAIKRDFSRWGFDIQAEVKGAIFHAAYLQAKDDLNAFNQLGGVDQVKNDAWFVEGIYVFRRENGSPLIVPLVRFDRFEKNNGLDDFGEVTLNLSYYITNNAKIYLEWFKQVDVPAGQSKGGRLTVEAHLAF